MTALDLLFEIVEEKDFKTVSNYEYWSINDEGKFLYNKALDSSKFEKEVILDLSHGISYIWEECYGEPPFFVPYDEIVFLSQVDIEIKGKISYNNIGRQPLVCVRGMCNKPCKEKPNCENMYCLREIPCTNKRPDWNIWSRKHPSFSNFFFDIVDFVRYCSNTNTFIVMFEFSPNYIKQELFFDFVLCAVQIKGKKITFLTDSVEIKKLYEDYNRRFPTEDREIESSISYPERGFYFKF